MGEGSFSAEYLLSHLKSVAVEGAHLVHIGLDAGYVDGMVGADDGDAPLALELLDPRELGIVALASGDQGLAQLGIAAIDEGWQVRGLLLLAVAELAGEHHDGVPVALVEGAGEGNGVGYAAIEHGAAVDMGDGTSKGEGRGGSHDVDDALGALLLLEVYGTACEAVGGHTLHTHGVGTIGCIVVGPERLGQLAVEEVHVHDAVVAPQVAHSEVVALGLQVGKSVLGSAALMGGKRESIARTCRHGHEVREGDVVVGHPVEHAAGEDTAHAASFKYQCCMFELVFHRSCMIKGCLFFSLC